MSNRAPDIDVRLVRTTEDVATFLAWLDARLAVRQALAIDTETRGLEWWEPGFVRLWQIGDADGGWAIPVNWWGRVIHEAMKRITTSGTDVVMHNAKFDMHAMETEGWPVPAWDCVHDTAILLHLRRSDLPRALKGKQTAELLGPWVYKGRDLLTGVAKTKYGLKKANIWNYIPVDEPAYWAYGTFDTCLTARLFDQLAPVMTEFSAAYQREMHYMKIMYAVEKRGIRVDEKYTEVLQCQMRKQISADHALLQASGIDNPNSNDQVIALLEADYGFMPVAFTDTGKPQLDKGVLAELARAGGMQATVVETLVRYKQNVKWLAAYVDQFLVGADIHGRVHPSINTMAARTGRSSITYIPLQTLPSRNPVIRKCLLPPKGHDWYSLDYSNQEPRLLAHYGQSPALLKYFREGDGTGSVHDFVAGQMFGTYTNTQRSLAKVFGLSRSYGAGAEKMSIASGLPLPDVERLLPAYDDLMGLTAINSMMEHVAAERQPNPYIVTAGGRRSYADPDKQYTLTNFLCQGSGADMLKDATIRLEAEGLSDFINVPVHDEITFSFPKDEGQAMAEQARLLMQTDEFAVPMPVTAEGPGKSWGDLYT